MNRIGKILTPVLLTSCLTFGSHGAMAQAPHGDHSPDHNGFVLMHSTLHFEVVVKDGGGINIYFSSEARATMPAATVSDVVVEIERPDGSLEFVDMQISATGDYWTGTSKPVIEEKALVRAGFIFEDEPFFIDIPAAAFPPIMQKMQSPMVDLSEFDAH
ncbi:MAG: hypothetical protein ACI95C_000608 [Pseudohongiellaceae bacterium]|jgi:hypothetical protein